MVVLVFLHAQYAFGILLFELFSGERAHRGVPRALLPHSVALRGLRPVLPPHTPPSYRRLAERCWQAEPRQRWAEVEGGRWAGGSQDRDPGVWLVPACGAEAAGGPRVEPLGPLCDYAAGPHSTRSWTSCSACVKQQRRRRRRRLASSTAGLRPQVRRRGQQQVPGAAGPQVRAGPPAAAAAR